MSAKALTPIQDVIVACLAMGLTRKEIARLFHRAPKTIEFHISGHNAGSSIQEKLGFSDPARLTHYALLRGLVEPMIEVVPQ